MSGKSLWDRVRARARHALAAGALRPIDTERRTVVDGGVPFVIRSVSSLARKDATRVSEAEAARCGGARNPFLPYDPDLFVSDLSDTHVCLLNKFNVLEHHLLLVTRRFVDQETPLDAADFAVLGRCLAEIGGLGFYNGGTDAGASQRHKHLQVVPGPLAEEGPCVPIEPLLGTALATPGVVAACPALPFRHALAALTEVSDAAALRALYRRLLEAVGIDAIPTDDGARTSKPYNLLVTPRWMLAVPRRRENAEGISVNALGFAGSLFVRSPEQMRVVEAVGPMALLARVGEPPKAPSRRSVKTAGPA